jgi:hypothetical protein
MASKRLPPRTTVKKDADVRGLLRAIDDMQDMAPGTVTDIHNAPDTSRGTPWRLAVRFIFEDKATTYEDIFQILRDWRDDKRIESLVGKDRLARIQVRYVDKKGRGSHGEYTLGEIGSFSKVVSRSMERVGIRDGRNDSLIERYFADAKKRSYIESLIVWFSPFTQKEIRSGKHQTAKPSKPKNRRRVRH